MASSEDYNYVEDVLDALLIAATEKNAIGKVYNLGAATHSVLRIRQRLCAKR